MSHLTPKTTAKTELLRILPPATSADWLAVHEAKAYIPGYSENCLATRLPELAQVGAVVSRTRPGKAYKEWARAAA